MMVQIYDETLCHLYKIVINLDLIDIDYKIREKTGYRFLYTYSPKCQCNLPGFVFNKMFECTFRHQLIYFHRSKSTFKFLPPEYNMAILLLEIRKKGQIGLINQMVTGSRGDFWSVKWKRTITTLYCFHSVFFITNCILPPQSTAFLSILKEK